MWKFDCVLVTICVSFCTVGLCDGPPELKPGLIPIIPHGRIPPVPRYYVSTFDASWYDAEVYCRGSGRALVSTETDIEQSELELELEFHDDLPSESFWLSLTDYKIENKFVWFTTVVDLGYSNWANDTNSSTTPGDPESAGNSDTKDCASLDTNFVDVGARWRVNDCGDHKFFICETLCSAFCSSDELESMCL